uniref:Uncharacterized protein n=1 Tax=Timema douglasi TaxID=61478 RepID=A0A7R8VYX2_TIMDO|nr:unnamed protein product [Timema douglasi]
MKKNTSAPGGFEATNKSLVAISLTPKDYRDRLNIVHMLKELGRLKLEEVNPHLRGGRMKHHLGKKKVHPTEIRTSISPSSAVKLNRASALANYDTEAGDDITPVGAKLSYLARGRRVAASPIIPHDGPSEASVSETPAELYHNYSSLMASLVLGDSSQLTSDSQHLGAQTELDGSDREEDPQVPLVTRGGRCPISRKKITLATFLQIPFMYRQKKPQRRRMLVLPAPKLPVRLLKYSRAGSDGRRTQPLPPLRFVVHGACSLYGATARRLSVVSRYLGRH